MTGFGRIGGVAGANLGMIRNCIAKANVAAITISAGGIVGEIFNGGTVQNCAVYGNVSGKQEIGGIVGYHNGVINNCAVNGGVTGNAEVGGVVGHRSNSTSSTVKSCYWKKTGSEPFNQNAVGFGMTSDGPLTNLISFSTITPLGEVTLSTVHSVYATSDLLTVLNAWVSENQMTTNAILNWWKIVPDNRLR